MAWLQFHRHAGLIIALTIDSPTVAPPIAARSPDAPRTLLDRRFRDRPASYFPFWVKRYGGGPEMRIRSDRDQWASRRTVWILLPYDLCWSDCSIRVPLLRAASRSCGWF